MLLRFKEERNIKNLREDQTYAHAFTCPGEIASCSPTDEEAARGGREPPTFLPRQREIHQPPHTARTHARLPPRQHGHSYGSAGWGKKKTHIVIAFHPSSQFLQPLTTQTLIPGNDLKSMCYPSVIPIFISSISNPPPSSEKKTNITPVSLFKLFIPILDTAGKVIYFWRRQLAMKCIVWCLFKNLNVILTILQSIPHTNRCPFQENSPSPSTLKLTRGMDFELKLS